MKYDPNNTINTINTSTFEISVQIKVTLRREAGEKLRLTTILLKVT